MAKDCNHGILNLYLHSCAGLSACSQCFHWSSGKWSISSSKNQWDHIMHTLPFLLKLESFQRARGKNVMSDLWISDSRYSSLWFTSAYPPKSSLQLPVASSISQNKRRVSHLRVLTDTLLQDDKQKRHLLRLWIAPEDDRPLPEQYGELLGGSITPGMRGGIIVSGTSLQVTAEAEWPHSSWACPKAMYRRTARQFCLDTFWIMDGHGQRMNDHMVDANSKYGRWDWLTDWME